MFLEKVYCCLTIPRWAWQQPRHADCSIRELSQQHHSVWKCSKHIWKIVASIASNLSTVVRVDVAENLNLCNVTQCWCVNGSWCFERKLMVQALLHLQRWRDCIHLKHWELHNQQHRVTSQKTWNVFPLLICYTHFSVIRWVLSHNLLLHLLQKAAFAKFPDLHEFSLANVASVDTREALLKHFGPLRYVCRTVGCLQCCCIRLEIIWIFV